MFTEAKVIEWLVGALFGLVGGIATLATWAHKNLRNDHEKLEEKVNNINKDLLTKADLNRIEEKFDKFIADYYKDLRYKLREQHHND